MTKHSSSSTSPSQPSRLNRTILIYFLWLFLPLFFLVSSFIYIANDIHETLERESFELVAKKNLQLQHDYIRKTIRLLVNDLVFLQNLEATETFLTTETHKTHSIHTKELISFSKARGFYDQIRLLKPDGQEVLRINNNDGKSPFLVPKDGLQNKADRYYFKSAINKTKNSIYISPLDLNIEHGEVEWPYKPMIRLAMPIYSSKNIKIGVLVLNYKAEVLLQQFRSMGGSLLGQLYLLNEEGHYLIGPSPTMEWGHSLEDRANISLKAHDKGAWDKIIAQESGLFYNHHGLYSFAHVHLNDLNPSGMATEVLPSWYVVSFVQQDELIPEYKALLSTFMVGLSLILFFIGFGSYWHAKDKAHRNEATKSLEIYKNKLEELVESKTQELLTAEEHYKAVVENDLDGILIIVEDQIVYANPKIVEISGYSNEDLNQKKASDLYQVNMQNPVKQIVGQQLYEGYLTSRNLVITPIEIYFVPIVYRSENAQLGFVRDTSENKQSQDMIQRLLRAVEQSPISILITDKNGAIEYVNTQLLELTGYTKAELIGKNPRLFKSGYQDKNIYSDLWKTILSGEPWQGEFLNKKKDGSLFWESVLISPIFDHQGQLMNFVGIKEDITEKKHQATELKQAKETAEASSRIKADFLATMSHEIRTPMNGLIGMLNLLKDTPLTAEQQQYLGTMQISGDNLLHIINDILDFSKIEAGKLNLEQQPVNLRACIEETFDLFSLTAAEKQIELVYSISESIPEEVLSDPTRVKQILMNLVGNAIKFTPKGEIYVSLSQGPSSSKRELRFAVTDTGIGIAPEKVEQLFKAFTQADSSTTRKYGGTGLGLSISKRLTEMMNGSMWAESEINKGSTFYFTLQVAEIRGNSFVTTSQVLGHFKALCFSDNKHIVQFLRDTSKKFGTTVSPCAGKAELIEQLNKKQNPNIIFIDEGLQHTSPLPEYDGDYTQSLLRIAQDHQIPVIYLQQIKTSDINTSNNHAPYQSLLKPLKKETLYNAIRDALGFKTNLPATAQSEELFSKLAEELPMKILLVEDNPINMLLAKKIVNKLGYHPETATNGIQALEIIENKKIDIIFMDIQMPVMDGLTASQEIFKRYPEERPTIIAMTANAMQEDKAKYLNAGMDDYISKPIHPKIIQHTIEKWGRSERNKNQQVSANPSQEYPLIDYELLDGRKQLGGGFINRFLEAFFEQMDAYIPKLSDAIIGHHFKEIMEQGHMLKGCASNVGAVQLSEIGKMLQFKGEDENPVGLTELVNELLPCYDNTKKDLQKYLLDCPEEEEEKEREPDAK